MDKGALEEYRRSLAKLVDNAREIEELTLEMTESAAAINKGSGAMKSDLLAEAASNVMHVNRGATETGAASEEVLNSARTLSTESSRLREELDRFMANIRAA